MPIEVLIADEQDALAINDQFADRISTAVNKVLVDHDVKDAEISVAIVDDPTIHGINREFLQHDYPTDVITFPLSEDDVLLEGEIVVSADTAIREASLTSWAAEDELLLYIIHGTLHLVGFDDHEEHTRAQMKKMERKYLMHFQIPGAELHQ